MKKPTAKQIEAEIKTLKEIKPKVRHYTYFNDNNWDAIDAEIEVLEKNLSEDDILNRTQFEDEEEDDSKWKQHASDSARSARDWLDGEESEPPSKGWLPLIKD